MVGDQGAWERRRRGYQESSPFTRDQRGAYTFIQTGNNTAMFDVRQTKMNPDEAASLDS